MTPLSRVRAALDPALTPDRPPVSAWGHWYDRETTAGDFAEVMLEFQSIYEWDMLKLHARASYHVEGWGFRYAPSTHPARVHETTGQPIAVAADWAKLRPLPLHTPALSEQIEAIRLVRARMPPDVPLVMTVFLPLDVADKLVNRDGALILRHLEENEAAVRSGLDAIAETFTRFVAAVAAEGVDGIYFSTKWANARRMREADYDRIARTLDLAVIAPARGLWCNMLHLCEDAIHLRALADYPVAMFHWDCRTRRNPSLSRGREILGPRAAVGSGVAVPVLAEGSAAEVRSQAEDAIRQTAGRGLLLSPGCSILTARTPPANLLALRDSARAFTS
jgi:uroporphyrinogen decarboxylase